MFRSGVVLLLITVGAVRAQAQTGTPPNPEMVSVMGTVVDAKTGMSIPRALVRGNGGSADVTALSDETGTFRIAVPFTRQFLVVMAEKPGYERQTSQNIDDFAKVRIALQPLNVIEGRITDSDGDPIPYVVVETYLREFRYGRLSYTRQSWAKADDRGRYRLAELRAGSYLVRVAGRENRGTTPIVGDAEGFGADVREAFPPTWHGGLDGRSATPVILTAGDQAKADIVIRAQNAYRVRGTVRNIGPSPVTLRLLDSSGMATGIHSAVNRETGQFQLVDVPPGTWTLDAWSDSDNPAASPFQNRARATEQITVGTRNLSNIVLELAPPVYAPLAPRSDDSPYRSVQLRPVQQSAVIWDRYSAGVATGSTQGNADLSIGPLYPGAYALEPISHGAYISSAVSGSVNLLDGGVLQVTRGSVPQSVEVVIRKDGGRIEGRVEGPKKPPKFAILFINERGQPATLETNTRLEDGSFESPMLAPGEYRVFAVPYNSEYSNPDSWKPFEGAAKRVRVEANGNHSVTLAAPQEATR